MYSVEGTRILLTVSCTIEGFVAVFTEGAHPFLMVDRVPGTRLFLSSVRFRFDKTAPVSGMAMGSILRPESIGFTSVENEENLGVLSPTLLIGKLQSASGFWFEFKTVEGLHLAKFAVPADSRSVIHGIFEACGERPPD
jgi:hypothetical protein